MKRYMFALLLVACAGACTHNNKPSETMAETRTQPDGHLYGHNASTTNASTTPEAEMTAPEHRTSDEIASTGEGLPDSTRPASPASNANSTGTTSMNRGMDSTAPTGTVATPAAKRAPDNTGVNERDRSGATLTPMDQGESDKDVKLTQDIRRAIVDSDALSFSSKNVKVITRNGKVTLRGTVPSSRERGIIEDAAKSRAGAGSVENQIEISNK